MLAANIPFEMFREAHALRLQEFQALERAFRPLSVRSELHQDLWWAFHQFAQKNRIVAAHWSTAVSAAFRQDPEPIIGLLVEIDNALFVVDHLQVQLFHRHGLKRPPTEAAEAASVMSNLSKGLLSCATLFLVAAPATHAAIRERRPNRPSLDILAQSSW